jgi:hypothetical protein
MRSWGVAFGRCRSDRMSRKALRWGCSDSVGSGSEDSASGSVESRDVTGRRSTRLCLVMLARVSSVIGGPFLLEQTFHVDVP